MRFDGRCVVCGRFSHEAPMCRRCDDTGKKRKNDVDIMLAMFQPPPCPQGPEMMWRAIALLIVAAICAWLVGGLWGMLTVRLAQVPV